MADCVHARCVEFITCQFSPGATALNQEVGVCEWCQQGCVFNPGEMLWLLIKHRDRHGVLVDQLTCRGATSPDGKHWVKR